MADNLEQNTPVETPASDLSPVEQKALDQGWVPKDDWQGDPDDWRPAKEFVDRGELFKQIDSLRRESKQLRQGHEALLQHHQKVRQAAYEEALATLKSQKKAALADGDVDAVVEIDEKLAEQKELNRQAQTQQTQQASQPDPVFEQWVNKNSWYTNDPVMKGAADEVARQAFLRGNRDRDEILAAVEREIKKSFPQKFENPRRASAPAVEGTTKPGTIKREQDADMSDAERQVMNKILRVTPGLTKEQYLKEFKGIKARGA